MRSTRVQKRERCYFDAAAPRSSLRNGSSGLRQQAFFKSSESAENLFLRKMIANMKIEEEEGKSSVQTTSMVKPKGQTNEGTHSLDLHSSVLSAVGQKEFFCTCILTTLLSVSDEDESVM